MFVFLLRSPDEHPGDIVAAGQRAGQVPSRVPAQGQESQGGRLIRVPVPVLFVHIQIRRGGVRTSRIFCLDPW
jgi:hypothetical protein